MRRLRRAAALALLCAVLPAGACVAVARAHATLERSSPAAGAAVTTPLRQVDLYFAEPIADAGGQSFAAVLDANGRTVSSGAQGDPADPRHLAVPLSGTLDAGSYTVFWKSTSASDGGTTLGDFPFSIGAAAATPVAGGQVLVPDTLRTRALSSNNGGSGAAWLVGGAIGVVIGAGATAAVFALWPRRRGRGGETSRRVGRRRR